MLSLTSCFIKTDPEDQAPVTVDGKVYYPIAIAVPPNKIRILYFDSTQQKKLWTEALQKVMGYSNVFDFYTFEQTLGKG